jgi:hypothetical protein
MQSNNLFHPMRHWSAAPEFLPALSVKDAVLGLPPRPKDQLAFELGEVLGVHRLCPATDWISRSFERGYEQGLEQPAKQADAFQREVLTLRHHAMAQSIQISPAVTADFLRRIAVSVCPVSGDELNLSSSEKSSGSIDRLDPTLGYVPGNILYVARRIKQIKNDQDCFALARKAQHMLFARGHKALTADAGNGLAFVEVLRISALSSAAAGLAQGAIASFAPLASAPMTWVTADAALAAVHVASARLGPGTPPNFRRLALLAGLEKQAMDASNTLVRAIQDQANRGVHPCDIWLDGRPLLLLNEVKSALLRRPSDGAFDDSTEGLMNHVVKAMNPLCSDLRH